MTAKKTSICLAFLVAAILLSFASHQDELPKSPLVTLTGKKVTLQDFHGKPVLVTFWATDCPSCLAEIPALTELYQHYHQQGLEIFAIAMYHSPPNHVVNITNSYAIPYDVVLDLNAQHAHDFGNVQLTPTTFLITPQGNVVLQKIGAFDLAEMQKKIETLLKG
ncbi:MAG: TlpA disulfide reductase family protein [Methylococcaceae bacterium]|jgi:peroxiredoxin